MRNSLIVLFILLFTGLAGCRASHEAQPLAGPVVFVDAAGNRMVVDNQGAAPTQEAAEPVAEPPLVSSQIATENFRGDAFVDSDVLMRELEQRESARFYVIPDGTGGKQLLQAGDISAVQPQAEPVKPDEPAVWRVCRVVVPLLSLEASRRYDVVFPAEDAQGVMYAGYRIAAPADAKAVRIDMFIRNGQHALPLLARVDQQGRVLSIVNNLPTQSIPETVFRYASVVGKAALIDGMGNDYAVLDGSKLAGRLPAQCGMAVPAGQRAGQVTVQFSGSAQ